MAAYTGTRALIVVVAAFVVGAGAWALFGAERCGNYRLVNNDFACGGSDEIDKTDYLALENDLRRYIDDSVATGTAQRVSVYFRDLRSGPSFSINTNEAFAPASLLKLPVIIALFVLEEEAPGLLQKKLRYSPQELDAQFDIQKQINFNFDGNAMIAGGEYTIRELMRASIVYSDNYAYFTLLRFINYDYPGGTAHVHETLQDLGVIDPRNPQEETVTVRNYASLLRLLYNVAFLSPEDSELLLGWLAESTFDEGLAAGVPPDTVVASKFGERGLEEGNALYDCGIIYYPQTPYTLCVMTVGQEWPALKTIISHVSEMVYKEVDSRAR